MLFKTTNKLFKGAYQYKIVLICAGASWFRSGDMDATLDQLKKATIQPDTKGLSFYSKNRFTQDDIDYAFKLQAELSKMSNIDVRVESPWISIYANDKSYVDKLSKIDESKVKYVCVPPANTALEEGTILLPKTNYDYRVTLGKTIQNHSAFISWAESNKKLKLTKSCIKELSRSRSWGGAYFYLTGENNLLMAKMHLGGSIAKIERIIKA